MSHMYLKHVIELLYIRSRKAEKSPAEKGFNAQWFHNGMNRLCRMVQEIGHSHLQPLSMLHVEYVHPKDYIDYKNFIRKHDVDSEDYKICCDTTALRRYLDQQEKDIFAPNYEDEYEDPQTHSIEEEYKNDLMSCMCNTKSANEAEILFERWIGCKFTTEGALLSEEQIAQFITEAEKGSLLHNCTICQLIAHGGSKAHPEINAVLEEEDDKLVQTLSELISQFTNYDDLLLRYKVLWKYVLYKRLVQNIFTNKCVYENYWRWTNVAKIIHHYSEITSTLDLPLEAILNACETSNFQNSITPQTAPYIPAQFFVDTRELGQNELVQHCRETAIQYLNTLSKEEWEIAVREKNHAYELFTALQCDPPENGKEILA